MTDVPERHAVEPGDAMARLAAYTDARIGLARHGTSLSTSDQLDLAAAHARARDAVGAEVDWSSVAAGLATSGLDVVAVTSRAVQRPTYLRRPDLGRQLSDDGRTILEGMRRRGPPDDASFDFALVVADGLSATAVTAWAVPTALQVLKGLPTRWRIAPIVTATGGRVGLSDQVGTALAARVVVMLIGERPGLSAADSLGAYLTFDPGPGRTDADRNCVSNIRAAGLAPALAAERIASLAVRAVDLGRSGIGLKGDDDGASSPGVLERPQDDDLQDDRATR